MFTYILVDFMVHVYVNIPYMDDIASRVHGNERMAPNQKWLVPNLYKVGVAPSRSL